MVATGSLAQLLQASGGLEILLGLPGHMGFIIIEHDMDVALRVAESVSMMHNGRIFKEGKPAEIEEDPEVQALYLGGDDG